MEAKATNNQRMINCANCIINTENYSQCSEFKRYTAQIREFWNRYHLDNYSAVFNKQVVTDDNHQSVFTLLVTINLLDAQTLESLQRKTGTEPWLDAIESFEEAINDINQGASDSCFGCSVTSHTGDSQEELDEAGISASTIHLLLNLIH